MKTFKFHTVILIVSFCLTLITCDGVYTGDYKSFESKLRGTWVSNDPGLYSGSLIIDYNTITIEGYPEDWTSMVGDDNKRPFKDYPKHVPLTGYSEDGRIFIEYGETTLEGIPYLLTDLGSYPQKYKLLEFTFGGRKEVLQLKSDY
jgi:hypothetical protein